MRERHTRLNPIDRRLLIELEKIRSDLASQQERANHERLVSLEQWKLEAQTDLEDWRNDNLYALESHRAAVGYAGIFLNGLILATGGAIVALMAFVGTRPDAATAAGAVESAFLCFVGAIGCALGAAGFSFLAQEQFTHSDKKGDEHYRRGMAGRLLAVVLSLAAMGLSGYAAVDSLGSITKYQLQTK